MRNPISITMKIAGKILIAGAAMIAMHATAAHAEATTAQQRAEAEMNQGKDYTAAWASAMRAPLDAYSSEQIALAAAAEQAMNEGKDYRAAWDAASRAASFVPSPEQIEMAARFREELRRGADYVTAWEAGDRAQAAPVLSAQPEPAKAASSLTAEGPGTTTSR